ncbi:MAG: DUF3277 family protein [Nanoarchaeota archaeon]|nr:DUF3277 family protein [Nanoarchaeota archaeon]
MVRTYDPKKVILTVGGVPVSGYADGTFITVERSADNFSKVVGAHGQTSRAKTNDFSGSLTVTLAQTSMSNNILQGFAVADELSNDGVVPIQVKDNSGTSVFFSANGWIRKPANAEFGKEISNREWIFDLADLDMAVGGNLGFDENP